MRTLVPILLAMSLVLPAAAQAKKETASKVGTEAKEAKINWDGEWTLVVDESDKLEPMIDEHVKDLNFVKKMFWKKKLQKACKVWQNLDILAGNEFTVTMNKERAVETAPDGTASGWERSDGEKFQVTLRKDGPRMTQIFQGDGYTLTHIFSMRKDGKTLALQATYSHKDLANPFSYKMVFKRGD